MSKKITKTERKKRQALLEKGRADPQNQNSVKHGIYANHFRDEQERTHYETFVNNLVRDLKLTLPADIEQAEVAGIYHLQIYRAFAANDFDAQDKAARAARAHLASLRATRQTREVEHVQGQSFCEIVSGLITDARAKGLI